MSARKKWRLTLAGGFRPYRVSSKAAAYRDVCQYRDQFNRGLTWINAAVVEVDEGDGWELYEHVKFGPLVVSRER